MTAIVNELHTGHRHLNHLLEVLGRQIDAFECGRTPDMPLMRDVIDGLSHYASAGENELIDELARQDDRFASARAVLIMEHRILAGLGEQCLSVIDDIIAGTMVVRTALVSPARDLARLFRSHLEREHGYLLRHHPAEAASPGEQSRQRLHPHPPVVELTDVQDRILHATALQHLEPSGKVVCPACVVDAEVVIPADWSMH